MQLSKTFIELFEEPKSKQNVYVIKYEMMKNLKNAITNMIILFQDGKYVNIRTIVNHITIISNVYGVTFTKNNTKFI